MDEVCASRTLCGGLNAPFTGLNGVFVVSVVVLMAVVQTGSDNVTASLPASSSTLVSSVHPSPLVPQPTSPQQVMGSSSSLSSAPPSSSVPPSSPSVSFSILSSSPFPSLPTTHSLLGYSSLESTRSMLPASSHGKGTSTFVPSLDGTSVVSTPSIPFSASPIPSSSLALSGATSSLGFASSPERVSPSPALQMSSPPTLPMTSSMLLSTSLATMPTTEMAATRTSPLYTTSLSIIPSRSPTLQLSPTPPYSEITPTPSYSGVIPTPSYSGVTPTLSLRTTPIHATPSPTVVVMTTGTTVPMPQPNELSLLEWFGIAVGAAAVFFILFLLYHCHQVRRSALKRQRKEMRKEILHVDFAQGNHGDRASSWRNSMALDAMTTHIELPREDSMDMQWMDNLGFEEVFLGDEPKAGNNNSLLPQTDL